MDALLGGIPYPFIGTMAQFTMYDSCVYLYHIYGQSFFWKAHEQLALEGLHVRRGMATCPLYYGYHVVAQRQETCESLSVHRCAFLIKTRRQKTARQWAALISVD
jgi:hypothetical protein